VAPSTNPAILVKDFSIERVRRTGPLGKRFFGGERKKNVEGHGIDLGWRARSPDRQRGT
jgi:hypothetical protein